MIPRTFPSDYAFNGQQQMVVYFLSDVTGLQRWADYIPVKLAQGGEENSYDNDGFIDVEVVGRSLTDIPFKDYVPVYADPAATDAWQVNATGYIPYGYAGTGDVSLSLDFTSGNQSLDPRITFSRASNATVTGPDGVLEYAPHNLLTHSEQFDNASWGKLNASVTANSTIAPDGTLTADKLVENTSTSGHSVNQGVSGAFSLSTITVSIYVKAAERTAVSFWIRGAVLSNRFQFAVDLTNGSISGQQNLGNFTNGAATAEAVGNDWYRISARVTTGGSESIVTLLSYIFGGGTVSDPTYTGDGTSGLFLWGAQLNVGPLQPYYPTSVKNALGYSQEFDNAAWTKSNATVTANATTAPDGSLTADKLVEDTANTSHFVRQNIVAAVGAPYNGSIHLKAGERQSAVVIHFDGAVFSGATINLLTGQVSAPASGLGLASAVAETSVSPMGNGWFRVAIVKPQTSTTTAQLRIALAAADSGVYTGDGTSGIYIWGAQLSDSASLDPYVYNPEAAPTAQAYYGPRFDYDPVTLAPKGLLIEEQRTNLLTYSSEFDNVAWNKVRAIILSNTVAAPDGSLTADKLVAASGETLAKYVENTAVAVSSGATYTGSVYLKLADAADSIVTVYLVDTGIVSSTTVDIESGAVVSGPGQIAAIVNGWFRVSVTGQLNNATARFRVLLRGGSNYTGDGASGLYLWGAQLEAGAFPTSYIPTTTAEATRAADVAVMTGANFSNWYRQDEGTLFADFIRGPDGIVAGGGAATPRVLNVDDGTNSLQVRFNSSATIEAASNIGIYIARNWSANVSNKAAVAYKADDSSLGVNSSVASDLSGSTGSTMTNIKLGANTAGTGGFLNGHIRRIGFFPRRLTNSELQGITS